MAEDPVPAYPINQRGQSQDRLARALLSLQGLSCGDAFGQSFFFNPLQTRALAEARILPPAPWPYTDDTLMAISIVRTLMQHGSIDQAELASSFAALFDPMRDFGPSMYDLLPLLRDQPSAWPVLARALFNGQGSYGNGAAMRVAPLGAFYADDLALAAEQAQRSAVVTHSHPEASAGAIAVAVAAALAWQGRATPTPGPSEFLLKVHAYTPPGRVAEGIEKALALPPQAPVVLAAVKLGNGSRVSAEDTVPFALWNVATSLNHYEDALWRTVSGLGDRDTTCAIVGGIVILRTGAAGIPVPWHPRLEPYRHLLASRP